MALATALGSGRACSLAAIGPTTPSVALGGALGDRLLQILQFFATCRAKPGQQADVFVGFGDFATLHVKLAQILKRAFVVGLKLEGLAIIGIGLGVVAALAQAE